MIEEEKFQKYEDTHALAEFVILQDKRKSLQDLCDFSTKLLNKKCISTRSHVFPSYQTSSPNIISTGSMDVDISLCEIRSVLFLFLFYASYASSSDVGGKVFTAALFLDQWKNIRRCLPTRFGV
jgi:hypothetical protein